MYTPIEISGNKVLSFLYRGGKGVTIKVTLTMHQVQSGNISILVEMCTSNLQDWTQIHKETSFEFIRDIQDNPDIFFIEAAVILSIDLKEKSVAAEFETKNIGLVFASGQVTAYKEEEVKIIDVVSIN